MDFEITIPNLPALRRAFREYPKIAEPIYQKAIVATGFIFQKNNLKDDPTPWKTGNLLQSFRFSTQRLVARYFPTARYAIWVHEGTRPHKITAKGRALAWEGAGGMMFAKSVQHPGTKANPFMPRIRDKAQPEIQKLMGQAADLVNKKIADLTNHSS